MSPPPPVPSAAHQLSRLDELAALPFPAEERRSAASHGWSGPGYHFEVLRESRDFWESRAEELVEAAESEIEAARAALAAVLTARWGPARTVELWPYLGSGHPDPGYQAPEPLSLLAGLAAGMEVWRPPGTERWVALAVGQADPEFPVHLLAAIGHGPLPGP
ncbi:hypothetical protein ACIQUQ_18840 [Streptomyces sp. NPDC101118]|uniref:hypothetical protein n=1 Tax=Streptomyces sp. NPDC101118 TaxID=3366109 RepID=UPI0037FDBEA1